MSRNSYQSYQLTSPNTMAATADAFEEHLCVIAALKDSYMRRDDAASVEQINTMTEELAQLCTVREDEVKAAIKGARDCSAFKQQSSETGISSTVRKCIAAAAGLQRCRARLQRCRGGWPSPSRMLRTPTPKTLTSSGWPS